MARRQHFSLMVILTLVAFFSVTYLFSSGASSGGFDGPSAPLAKDSVTSGGLDLGHIDGSILSGGSIAPKLENATAKYALLDPCSFFPLHPDIPKHRVTFHNRPSANQDFSSSLGPSSVVPRGGFSTP